MVNSRDKGANGERELARLVADHVGVKLVRNLQQARGGGYDLIAEGDGPVADYMRGLAIECKRYSVLQRGQLVQFWEQAVRQAMDAGKVPVLAYRSDRQLWRFVVPLKIIASWADHQIFPGYAWTADLSADAFFLLVREMA